MLISGLADALDYIIQYINTEYKNASIPKIMFDELSVHKDSLCLSVSDSVKPTEKIADVCGGWLHGVVDISLTYRKMLIDKGSRDIDIIRQLDDIYNFLKENYKYIETNDFFIKQVNQKSGALLDTVYVGGIKDFKCIISIIYERRQ